jgi:Holliday junction resolvase RusA-like endonuclease
VYKFVFPGNPVAQSRFRSITRGGKSWLFDPQGKEKRLFSLMAKDQVDETWKFPEYPRINFWFLMPIPKSMRKEDRILAETGSLKHIKKPDVDNLIKFYLDIMTGSIIQDDNCVQIGKAVKLYAKDPRTIIFLQETSKIITDREIGEY